MTIIYIWIYINIYFINFFQTYVDIFNSLNSVNITAIILSCITILALIFNNEVLKVSI